MFQNTLNHSQLFEQQLSLRDSNKKNLGTVLFMAIAILAFFASGANAASGEAMAGGTGEITQLQEIWDFIVGIVSGWGGKVLALLALVFAFWSAFEANWRAVAGACGVAVALAFGPQIIEGIFDAAIVL